MYEGFVVYLSSIESTRLGPVRRCQFIREIKFDTAKVGFIVRLEPGFFVRISEFLKT